MLGLERSNHAKLPSHVDQWIVRRKTTVRWRKEGQTPNVWIVVGAACGDADQLDALGAEPRKHGVRLLEVDALPGPIASKT